MRLDAVFHPALLTSNAIGAAAAVASLCCGS